MKFKMGWQFLWRDARAGQLRVLILAVTLAVAALTAVGFFADRIKGGFARDARALIGGDAVVSSDKPTPAAVVNKAKELGLQKVSNVSFPTMARAPQAQGGASKLVALKAVEPGYPLRGQLKVAAAPGQAEQATREIPALGSAWVDAGLLDALGLALGDTLLLGESAFRVDRIIVSEPDRGAGFVNFAPRVMIHRADLDATALVQPASRMTYRMAVAAQDQALVKAFSDWVAAKEKANEFRGLRLESLEGGRPEMSTTLNRAEKFLNLVALLAAVLSAVAIAIAARGFAQQHLDQCAMLRVLGVAQRDMAWAYALEFALVGLASSALGVLLGFGVHFGFVLLLAGLLESALPAPSMWPALLGLGMGLTLLAAFGLPPVLQLAKVPPLRVIRRDLGGIKSASSGTMLLGIAGFAALMMAVSRDVALGAIALGGLLCALLLFAGLSYVAVRLLRFGVNEATAPRWLILATRQISARPAYAVIQVSALAVGLLALVLLVLLRTDLIASWRSATPADAPNRFVINIMPEQGEQFLAHIKAQGVKKMDYFPMIRARLIAINGKEVTPESYADERVKRLVDREFNLSHAAAQPAHNQIVAGQWRDEEAGAVSVEQGIAKDLGLKIGDSLTFDMGGVPTTGTVRSLRKVDWGSLRANFFVMFTVSQMPGVALTYMSAFKAPDVAGFDNALIRQFPNLTNVDMSLTLNQVQRVLDQVIRAVEFLFAFTVLAGLVVLFAAVSATREERTREFAILRAMGAKADLLRQVQRAELAGVGLLAGVLASAVAVVIGWALAHYVFEFAWTASVWVLPLSGLFGALLALAAGWWGLREVLQTPVMTTLRRAAL